VAGTLKQRIGDVPLLMDYPCKVALIICEGRRRPTCEALNAAEGHVLYDDFCTPKRESATIESSFPEWKIMATAYVLAFVARSDRKTIGHVVISSPNLAANGMELTRHLCNAG